MIPVDLPPTQALESSLSHYVEEECNAAQVDIDWIGLDPALLPAGDWHWKGDPCRSRPNLFLSVVDNHQLQRRMMVRPSLTIWVEVPVAAESTPIGKMVKPTLGRVKLNELIGDPVSEAWRARIFIPKGTPITTAVVAPIPDATNGSDVKLIVKVRTLVISAEGRLMQDGAIGEDVRVRNNATGQIVSGVLRDSGTVVIQ
jgi:flagella basal body P-ring formation protein FlgA